MSKNNSKSLGTLRQKLRKYIKDFDQDLKKFRESPDAADDEDDEDETKQEEPELSEIEGESPTPKAVSFKKEVEKSKTTGN